MKKFCAMTKQIKCENQLNHLKEINKHMLYTFILSIETYIKLFCWTLHAIQVVKNQSNPKNLDPNFISGNCYDARQYGDYSLYCPYAYRLPNGTILAKDLAAEYNYLGNSSIWFYNARRKAQEIIDNNAPIYRGINGVTPLNIVFSFINYL